jgi:hypothetical protein
VRTTFSSFSPTRKDGHQTTEREKAILAISISTAKDMAVRLPTIERFFFEDINPLLHDMDLSGCPDLELPYEQFWIEFADPRRDGKLIGLYAKSQPELVFTDEPDPKLCMVVPLIYAPAATETGPATLTGFPYSVLAITKSGLGTFGIWDIPREKYLGGSEKTEGDYDEIIEFMFGLFMRALWYLNQPSTQTVKEDLRSHNRLARLRKKPTRAEYHMVTIDLNAQRAAAGTARDGDGHGTPKGEHGVRGHWRQYQSGPRVWVREHRRGEGPVKAKRAGYTVKLPPAA